MHVAPNMNQQKESAAYRAEHKNSAQLNRDSENEATDISLLDLKEKNNIDVYDKWQNTLENCHAQLMQFYNFMIVKKTLSPKERIDFYGKLLGSFSICSNAQTIRLQSQMVLTRKKSQPRLLQRKFQSCPKKPKQKIEICHLRNFCTRLQPLSKIMSSPVE